MSMNRRVFLKNTAITAGAAIISNKIFAGLPPEGELTGVQLYSVRDDMRVDPLGTLKKVAAMGYKHVEHASYNDRKFYGYPAKEFRKILDDLGLKMPSGHTVLSNRHWDASKNEFTDLWKYTVEDAAILGQTFVISPSLPPDNRKTADDVKAFMLVFNKSGELCAKSGMRFGYHNHDFEFTQKMGDTTLFDMILKETDPKLVIQQLDIGNMINGGAKALDIMQKYPGRFVSMHVKDEIAATGGHEKFESTILGTGVVPVKEVIDLGRKWGTKHFIIEQESYQGKQPLDSIREDLAIMKKWGY